MHVSRRSLLSGVGLGAAALLGGAFERQAYGQAGPAKRLLVLYMPNSSIRANWLPSGGRVAGASGDAGTFTLNKANSTLEPVRSLMTIVDGLDLKKIGGDPHGSGLIRLVTGGTINAGEGAKDPEGGTLGVGNLPVMPSIDQVLADKSASLKGPPVYSLQLAGDTRADEGRTDVHLRVMSYDLKLNPMPPEVDPTSTFTRLFANVMSGGAATPEQQAAAALALAREKSVLDFIKGDIGRLTQRLPSEQRPKLDSHLAAIQEYERTLVPSTGGGMNVTIPPAPEKVESNVSANHQQILEQYFGITKLAFQLDLTRVVTFMFGSGNSQVAVPGIPNLTRGIHPTAHDYLVEPLTQATAWYCDRVAKFVLDLQATKDADGSSILDNTIVVLASEVGQYHEFTNIPMVLFGGAKLGLKGGRCLRYSGRTPSDVWTAVAGALDAPMPTFGDPLYNQGPLPELFG
jgi:hypothetical protein